MWHVETLPVLLIGCYFVMTQVLKADKHLL